MTAAHLRSAGIPAVVFGVDAYAGYGAAFQNAIGARVMVRRADIAAAESFTRDLAPQSPQPRPNWIRGVAILALLLIAIPVAASAPQFLGLLAVALAVGIAVVSTLRWKRPTPASSQPSR